MVLENKMYYCFLINNDEKNPERIINHIVPPKIKADKKISSLYDAETEYFVYIVADQYMEQGEILERLTEILELDFPL